MNDFTKEDLIYMRDGVALIDEKCQCSIQMHSMLDVLHNKIQSMIDNYHEFKLPTMADYE